jgi:hypothetical protein
MADQGRYLVSNPVCSYLRSPATDRIVATSSALPRATLANDLDLAWGQIADATVDVSARSRAWRLWTTYCEDNGFPDPFLPAQTDTERLNILVAFAARCRTGVWGRGNQIQANTVATTVRYIGQTFELGGYPDPRHRGNSSGTDLHLAFSRLYHGYRTTDPASQSQIALPVKVFLDIIENEGASTDPLEQAIADFVVIAFYFLLRVGEYTCPSGNKRTRTVQFRRCDVTFWKMLPGGLHHQLDPQATLEDLLAADSVTLTLSNQKSGVRDATLNHEAVPGPFCPVKSLARRYHACRQAQPHNKYAILCNYEPLKVVTAKHIEQVLQRAAFRTTVWMEGFALDRIGPHSIRAAGAMQLYLNGISEAKIMKIGRWKSKTWLTYIHNQIAAVTAGVSRLMARPIVYYNVAVRQQT